MKTTPKSPSLSLVGNDVPKIKISITVEREATGEQEQIVIPLKLDPNTILKVTDKDSLIKALDKMEEPFTATAHDMVQQTQSACFKLYKDPAGIDDDVSTSGVNSKKKESKIRVLENTGFYKFELPFALSSTKTILKTSSVQEALLKQQALIGKSYRKVLSLIKDLNPYFYLPPTTNHDFVELFASKLKEAQNKQLDEILQPLNDGSLAIPLQVDSELPLLLSPNQLNALLQEYNAGLGKSALRMNLDCINDLPIEQYDGTVYVRPDEVIVKRQKGQRNLPRIPTDLNTVQNTMIHIEVAGQRHLIAATSMEDGFNQVLAFLIHNKLHRTHRVVVITDGARNIQQAIETVLHPVGIKPLVFWDWFHVSKRCSELISSANLGSKEYKKGVKKRLNAYLWINDLKGALDYLDFVKRKYQQASSKLDEVKDYLNRKSPYLTNYALRKRIGLSNSSNRVEKLNDVAVASRQKHNGMSWSQLGSSNLALIAVTYMNGYLRKGIEDGFENVQLFTLNSKCNQYWCDEYKAVA